MTRGVTDAPGGAGSDRYARNVILPEVGADGQARLGRARVLVIGAGGLGAPVSTYLAAAGVGHVRIVDDDVVELSNLQRQVLFGTDDVGREKATVAASALGRLNDEIDVEPVVGRVDESSIGALLDGVDVVVDGTDNFATRRLVNAACVRAGLPLVWASILRFDAQISVWQAGAGPCYACVFPEPPAAGVVPSCAQAGVLGAMVGSIGAVQATEALKLLLGVGEPLIGRLLVHDALNQRWDELPVRADPHCSVCGDGAPPSASSAGVSGSARGTVPEIAADELRALLGTDRVHVVDVRSPAEQDAGMIPGSASVPVELFLDGSALERVSADVPAGRPIVLVCHSGARSAQATRVLVAAGWDARSLAGGLQHWSGPWG